MIEVNNIIFMYKLSDKVDRMELENNLIGEYDLFLDQNNDTADNIKYISSQDHCNQTSVISEEGSLWLHASMPMLIASLILGQLIRIVD